VNESADENAALDPACLGHRARGRLRLLAVLALLVLWAVPTWGTVHGVAGPEAQIGAVRSGAPAAFALIALWGLSATALAARTLRGVRVGAALTDAALAAAMTLLLVLEHPWVPGGEARREWIPVFAPLTLLALLEAAVLRARRGDAREVAVIRSGAALFAAASLALADHIVPSAATAWLGLSPLLFFRQVRAVPARRTLEAWILVAGVFAGLAPFLQKTLGLVLPAVEGDLHWPVFLWCVTAALVTTTALDGLLRPGVEGEVAPRS
jgi:hypothetical protein